MGFAAKKAFTKWFYPLRAREGAVTGGAPLTQQADEALMEAYQRGDTQAFAVLLSRHQKPVFQYLLRFLKNREAAEEAFQEVFLRVIRSRNDYRPSAKFTTWLYTLARHYCIDQTRKNRLRDHASFEQESEKPGVSEVAFSRPAEAHALSSAGELERRLERLLGEMSSEQREVFLLRELEGLSFEEIGRVTEASVNTVKSRMRYALAFLQKRFRESGISPENDGPGA